MLIKSRELEQEWIKPSEFCSYLHCTCEIKVAFFITVYSTGLEKQDYPYLYFYNYFYYSEHDKIPAIPV